MPSQEEIAHQQELLAAHRRRLAHYLSQQAALGAAFVPPGIAEGIREARKDIYHTKLVLRGWGVAVANHPDDVSPGQAAPVEGSPTSIPVPHRPVVGALARFAPARRSHTRAPFSGARANSSAFSTCGSARHCKTRRSSARGAPARPRCCSTWQTSPPRRLSNCVLDSAPDSCPRRSRPTDGSSWTFKIPGLGGARGCCATC